MGKKRIMKRDCFVAMLLAMTIMIMPAYATDQQPAPAVSDQSAPAPIPAPAPALKDIPLPYTYKPPGCEFSIGLPSEPMTQKRCSSADPTACSDVTSFTKVFALDATVDVTMTCNKTRPDMYNEYTKDLMEKVLTALTGVHQLDNYQTASQEYEGDIRQAVLLGSGHEGNSEKIYTSQLWISRNSVFSLESSLIGKPLDDADNMFASIIRSIRHESWGDGPPPAPKKDTATADQKKEEQPAEKQENAAPAKKKKKKQ